MALAPDELLEYLDPEQREVACALEGAVCVRAGAGTGKTRAITYRLAYGVATGAYHPAEIRALTFTARAAAEMRSRLRDLGIPNVSAQTFHAAALRQLRYFWNDGVGGPFPELIPSKMAFVSGAASQLGLPNDRATVADVASEIEWAKASLVSPEEYIDRAVAAGRGEIPEVSAHDIVRLMRAYEEAKLEAGRIDFDDVLLLLLGLLLDRPDIARQVRGQYRRYVVDEYQDVSPLQHRLLQVWLGQSRELCVVGDSSQTIYSFAGATSEFLTGFSAEFPGARVIELVRNYRSTPQIVGAANTVISAGPATGAVRLQSQQASGVPIEYKEYADSAEEAEGIARSLAALAAEGHPYGSMAILYRVNAQSAEFENVLRAAGIPYRVAGAEPFFQRAEIRQAMVQLRAVRDGSSGTLVEDVEAVLRQIGWRPQPPDRSAGAAREKWDALSTLRTLAEEMYERRGATMAEFVADLEQRAAEHNPPSTDDVTLSTLHSAKGLEWPIVALAGLNEGLIPLSHADSPAHIEEERRLLYVGMTRARERLILTCTKGNRRRGRSRFVSDIWPKDGETVAVPVRQRMGRKELEEAFARDYPEDVALLRALMDWRRERAEEIGKPAYTIFPNSTLQAVAIAKPGSLAELARVRGVGQTKLARWGNEVIEVVTAHR